MMRPSHLDTFRSRSASSGIIPQTENGSPQQDSDLRFMATATPDNNGELCASSSVTVRVSERREPDVDIRAIFHVFPTMFWS